MDLQQVVVLLGLGERAADGPAWALFWGLVALLLMVGLFVLEERLLAVRALPGRVGALDEMLVEGLERQLLGAPVGALDELVRALALGEPPAFGQLVAAVHALDQGVLAVQVDVRLEQPPLVLERAPLAAVGAPNHQVVHEAPDEERGGLERLGLDRLAVNRAIQLWANLLDRLDALPAKRVPAVGRHRLHERSMANGAHELRAQVDVLEDPPIDLLCHRSGLRFGAGLDGLGLLHLGRCGVREATYLALLNECRRKARTNKRAT